MAVSQEILPPSLPFPALVSGVRHGDIVRNRTDFNRDELPRFVIVPRFHSLALTLELGHSARTCSGWTYRNPLSVFLEEATALFAHIDSSVEQLPLSFLVHQLGQ